MHIQIFWYNMDNSDWKLNVCVLGLELPKASLEECEYCILWTVSPEIRNTGSYFLEFKDCY